MDYYRFSKFSQPVDCNIIIKVDIEMSEVKIPEKYADDKAIIKFLQGLQKPYKFLQKYLKETNHEDMVIIIGHDQSLFIPQSYDAFFNNDREERLKTWKRIVENRHL